MWRHRYRRGKRGRVPKPIMLGASIPMGAFIPNPLKKPTPVFPEIAEVEAYAQSISEGFLKRRLNREWEFLEEPCGDLYKDLEKRLRKLQLKEG